MAKVLRLQYSKIAVAAAQVAVGHRRPLPKDEPCQRLGAMTRVFAVMGRSTKNVVGLALSKSL